MKDLDGRKIDRKALEEIRIRAVKRVEAGESPEVVIKALGFSRSRIYEWLAKYRKGGIDALRSRKAPGKLPKLNEKQRQQLYNLIVGIDPQKLNFEFALWTRGMVKELIWRIFKVNLSEVSVGRLLKKLGLSPQKPKTRACERDDYLVLKWVAQDYKEIQALARQENAEIFFGDESSVRSDYHSGTTWSPRGKTPIVTSIAKRYTLNLISAISSRGSRKFMATENKVNSDVFIEFLNKLLVGQKKPIFLILDNAPIHKSEKVCKFVQSKNGRLRIFFYHPTLLT